MPVEIKELHIKAIVTDTSPKHATDKYELKREIEKLKKQLLKECVEEVIQILELKHER